MTDRPAIAGGDPIRQTPIGYGSQSIGQAEKKAVLEVLDADYITRGPRVEAFEERVAEFVGVDHAIAATSGTAALHLAGLAAGFGPGDEVIVPPLTFVSTAFSAIYAGADPMLADIDPETRALDPDAVRDRLNDTVTGMIPVHYAGQPAPIDELLEIADRHDLSVIWDAAHALGSEFGGQRVGGERDMAVFSFHPVKNITTAEGGMVVTEDDELADRLRSYRSFCMDYAPPGHEDEPWYQTVSGVGFNYNMTDIQAALGIAQLDRIQEFKCRREEIFDRYQEAFSALPGLRTPTVREGVDPMWHLYAVEVQDGFGCSRRQFVEAMHAEEIYVQVHYVPLHYHPLFQERYGYSVGEFPATEQVYGGLVSLPLFPGMTESDVRDVIRAIERIGTHYQ